MMAERRSVDARRERGPATAGQAFRHEALLYNGTTDFVDTASSFLRDGVAAGEAVLVVVSAEKIDLLRDELGGDANRVEFADMAEVGSNPARIIPAWYDFVAKRGADGRHIRGIGEPISNDRSPQALVECQRHESLLNLAFEDASAWWLLCPYDTSALEDEVIDEALRSHPLYLARGEHRQSELYVDNDAFRRPFDRELPEPAVAPWELTFDLDTLVDVRDAVCRHAAEHGLAQERTDDLRVAVNEVAINSLRHGGGKGALRLWREGDMLTCEIRDKGRLDMPLVGHLPPQPGQEGGFGMWLVHQLCDLVQLRSYADGAVVRMHMSLSSNGRSPA